MRFLVLIVTSVKVTVFWDVMPCHLVDTILTDMSKNVTASIIMMDGKLHYTQAVMHCHIKVKVTTNNRN